MNKVIDKGFRSCRYVSTIVKHPVLPHPNFIFCGADFGSTIALNLQQKLKPLLHSAQEHIAMRSFLGIYSFFLQYRSSLH